MGSNKNLLKATAVKQNINKKNDKVERSDRKSRVREKKSEKGQFCCRTMGESEANGGSSGVIGQAQGRYNTRSNADMSNRNVTLAGPNKREGTNTRNVAKGIRNKYKMRDSKRLKKGKRSLIIKSENENEVKNCSICNSKKSGETSKRHKIVQSRVMALKSGKLSLKAAANKSSKKGKEMHKSVKINNEKITSKNLEIIPDAKNAKKVEAILSKPNIPTVNKTSEKCLSEQDKSDLKPVATKTHKDTKLNMSISIATDCNKSKPHKGKDSTSKSLIKNNKTIKETGNSKLCRDKNKLIDMQKLAALGPPPRRTAALNAIAITNCIYDYTVPVKIKIEPIDDIKEDDNMCYMDNGSEKEPNVDNNGQLQLNDTLNSNMDRKSELKTKSRKEHKKVKKVKHANSKKLCHKSINSTNFNTKNSINNKKKKKKEKLETSNHQKGAFWNDTKDLIVGRRMASLNASAIMTACYGYEVAKKNKLKEAIEASLQEEKERQRKLSKEKEEKEKLKDHIKSEEDEVKNDKICLYETQKSDFSEAQSESNENISDKKYENNKITDSSLIMKKYKSKKKIKPNSHSTLFQQKHENIKNKAMDKESTFPLFNALHQVSADKEPITMQNVQSNMASESDQKTKLIESVKFKVCKTGKLSKGYEDRKKAKKVEKMNKQFDKLLPKTLESPIMSEDEKTKVLTFDGKSSLTPEAVLCMEAARTNNHATQTYQVTNTPNQGIRYNPSYQTTKPLYRSDGYFEQGGSPFIPQVVPSSQAFVPPTAKVEPTPVPAYLSSTPTTFSAQPFMDFSYPTLCGDGYNQPYSSQSTPNQLHYEPSQAAHTPIKPYQGNYNFSGYQSPKPPTQSAVYPLIACNSYPQRGYYTALNHPSTNLNYTTPVTSSPVTTTAQGFLYRTCSNYTGVSYPSSGVIGTIIPIVPVDLIQETPSVPSFNNQTDLFTNTSSAPRDKGHYPLKHPVVPQNSTRIFSVGKQAQAVIRPSTQQLTKSYAAHNQSTLLNKQPMQIVRPIEANNLKAEPSQDIKVVPPTSIQSVPMKHANKICQPVNEIVCQTFKKSQAEPSQDIKLAPPTLLQTVPTEYANRINQPAKEMLHQTFKKNNAEPSQNITTVAPTSLQSIPTEHAKRINQQSKEVVYQTFNKNQSEPSHKITAVVSTSLQSITTEHANRINQPMNKYDLENMKEVVYKSFKQNQAEPSVNITAIAPTSIQNNPIIYANRSNQPVKKMVYHNFKGIQVEQTQDITVVPPTSLHSVSTELGNRKNQPSKTMVCQTFKKNPSVPSHNISAFAPTSLKAIPTENVNRLNTSAKEMVYQTLSKNQVELSQATTAVASTSLQSFPTEHANRISQPVKDKTSQAFKKNQAELPQNITENQAVAAVASLKSIPTEHANRINQPVNKMMCPTLKNMKKSKTILNTVEEVDDEFASNAEMHQRDRARLKPPSSPNLIVNKHSVQISSVSSSLQTSSDHSKITQLHRSSKYITNRKQKSFLHSSSSQKKPFSSTSTLLKSSLSSSTQLLQPPLSTEDSDISQDCPDFPKPSSKFNLKAPTTSCPTQKSMKSKKRKSSNVYVKGKKRAKKSFKDRNLNPPILEPVPSVNLVPWRKRNKNPPKHSNGWKWKGEGYSKKILLNYEEAEVERICYNEMIHKEGDTVGVKDCILLAAGTKRKDLPFVAKIVSLWENPEDGAMMLTVMWYYRREETDIVALPGDIPEDIFASKDLDSLSVACIVDKCFVLTLNEWNRYKKHESMVAENIKPPIPIVPDQEVEYLRAKYLPTQLVAKDRLFLCRKVYDSTRRIVFKNPSCIVKQT